MNAADTEPTRTARTLFAPLGPTYDRYANLLSFGQDPRWRRFLVTRVPAARSDHVLDVATGTAAVSIELARQYGCRVTGIDQSAEMLSEARRRVARAGLEERIDLVEGRAETLPFEPASFDHLTFTYLLRYVEDPAAALRTLARVVRPGGTLASLEFWVPPRPLARAAWNLYVDVGLPTLGRLAGPGWHEVGAFLGPSIRSFYERQPLERLLALWYEAGIHEVRARTLSLGGGVVIWGRRGD